MYLYGLLAAAVSYRYPDISKQTERELSVISVPFPSQLVGEMTLLLCRVLLMYIYCVFVKKVIEGQSSECPELSGSHVSLSAGGKFHSSSPVPTPATVAQVSVTAHVY